MIYCVLFRGSMAWKITLYAGSPSSSRGSSVFLFFLFSFLFAVVCLSFRFVFLFLIVFCFLVCLSFIPTAAPSSELHAKLDKTPQRER